MKVYLAEYCSCTHESAFGIKSIHATAKGAREAMLKSRQEEELYSSKHGRRIPEWMQWRVRAVQVKP